MKKNILTFLFICFFSTVFSQVEDAWVYFKDKPSEASYFTTPLNMLSQRSIDRRIRYGIAIDYKDVPIEKTYILEVKNSTGITVLAKSKWLNSLHIQGTKTNIDALLNVQIAGNFFVDSIEYANKNLNSSKPKNKLNKISKLKNKQLEIFTSFNYGNAENQILMLGGETLHQNNFTGTGMQIAVMDAGFPNVDNFLAFKRIRENGQILGGYDFVNRNTNYFTGYYHGMAVLSTMAGYLENGVDGATTDFVGTAPDADYFLFITEDSNNEVRLEESLWVEAAEKADSLGVDVINTSLGYSVFFDNTDHNYEYSDMDGQTAFITRGAEIAFSRGMIIVNSVGNEGNDPVWPFINAPADGPSVLTVGAVNSLGDIASFSSFGPTSNGRIKPDVCAQGEGTYLINSSGNVASGNGTSFSSPVLAGIVTCLWQAFPNKTNAEITQLVRESAHLYETSTTEIPIINYQFGYGIPNFATIFNALEIENLEAKSDEVLFYPNPVSSLLNLKFPEEGTEIQVEIYNLLGSMVYAGEVFKNNPTLDITFLPRGFYLMRVNSNNEIKTVKVLKK